MRFRTAAASAALVLCAMTATAACSSSDATDGTQPAGPAASSAPESVEGMPDDVETGKHQTGEPEMVKQEGTSRADCAVSEAQLPPDCEVSDLSSTDTEQGQPASGAPSMP